MRRDQPARDALPGVPGLSAGEGGFTLVELVTALTVLAIAVFGTATVFAAGMHASAAELHRTTAVSMAEGATERLLAMPYDSLAVAPPGVSPACDSGASVVTSASGAATTDPPAFVAGVSYDLSRCITWASSTSGTAPAYKDVTVVVTWTDNAGPHHIRVDSAAYRGGTAEGDRSTTTVPDCGTGSPAPATAVTAAAVAGGVDVWWTTPSTSPAPITGWRVEYSNDGFATTDVWGSLTSSAAGEPNRAAVGGLAPATAYGFRVVAEAPEACGGATSPPSAPVTVTAPGSSGSTCTVGLAAASPAVVARVAGSSSLAGGALTVTVATSGACSGLSVDVHPQTGADEEVPLAPAGATWTATIPPTVETWDLGTHVLDIVSGSQTVAETTVCVVDAGVTQC